MEWSPFCLLLSCTGAASAGISFTTHVLVQVCDNQIVPIYYLIIFGTINISTTICSACREPWLMWPWQLASPPSLHTGLSSLSAPHSFETSSPNEICLLRVTLSTWRMSRKSTWRCCWTICTEGRSTVQRVSCSDFLQLPGRYLLSSAKRF